MARIITLPGDGIGPEVLASALEVLRAVADDLEYEEHPFGGASIDAHGTALTDETLAACQGADAVLLAAVGGPKWDSTDPNAARPEQGLLGLRKGLGLYANLRPVRPVTALLDSSPIVRVAACQSLAQQNARSSIRYIEPLFYDKHTGIQTMAAAALIRLHRWK